MSREEMKAALTAKGVSFPGNASNAQLKELVDRYTGGNATDGTNGTNDSQSSEGGTDTPTEGGETTETPADAGKPSESPATAEPAADASTAPAGSGAPVEDPPQEPAPANEEILAKIPALTSFANEDDEDDEDDEEAHQRYFDSLVAEKVRAGLPRPQAIEVVIAQIDHDARLAEQDG